MSNVETQRQWARYVLRVMVQDPEVFQFVTTRLEPEHFQVEQVKASPLFCAVYGLLKKHTEEYTEEERYSVTDEALRIYIVDAVNKTQAFAFGSSEEGIKAEASQLYKYLQQPISDRNRKDPTLRTFVKTLYSLAVQRPAIRAAADEAEATGTYETLVEEIGKHRSALADPHVAHDPFDLDAADCSRGLSTGVAWMSELLGGGFRGGNLYNIIIPTGVGKTTLACQLGFSFAQMGMPASLIFSEQSMAEREMPAKFWSLATGYKSDEFLTDGFHDRLEITEDHETVIKVVRNNLDVYDFARTPGSLEEVENIALGRNGHRKPRLLQIDWAGEFAEQLVNKMPVFQGSITRALEYLPKYLARLSRQADIPIVLYHQLAPAQVGSPTKAYHHSMAHQCKSFCDNASYAGVMGPPDKNNVVKFCWTKTRWSGASSAILQRLGTHSRFDALAGYRETRRGFEPISDAKNPTIHDPTKKKRQSNSDWS